ncbi:MAG TPA: hypothetical protein VFV79_03510 [Saprospiraceae bacterium]|nr:hypothetical protein [Saprospiraceae bacterium]
MEKKKILIKVRPEGFYLNSSLLIPVDRTNLPWQHFSFHPKLDAFWEAELVNYHANTGSLKVIISDYNPTEIITFDTQNPKKNIEFLLFEKLHWNSFQLLLTSYKKSKFLNLLDDDQSPFFEASIVENWSLKGIDFTSSDLDEEWLDSHEGDKREIMESFWVPFNEINIGLGYVTFQHYQSGLDRTLDYKIYNDHLLPEFNLIRFWFAKKLKTKRLSVSARIQIEGNEVIEIKATSKHIDQIGPELIDSIKYQRIYGLTKQPKIKMPDKNLFTADEMFELFNSEDEEGNVFRQSEEDILKALLEKSNVRNKKQLAYLAGKKHIPGTRLRYTLYPHFGFLFFIEGEQCHHFVWELLNSHATYMWSMDKKEKTFDLQFQRLERTINIIRTSGREEYKRAYREQHTDQDLAFHFIPHEDIDSKLVDGFPKWKQRLNDQLI